MKSPPAGADKHPYVAAVCLVIERWMIAAARFDREVVVGINKAVGDVVEFRRSDGTVAQIHALEVRQWKLRVERLALEAEKQMAAGNWDWFWWLDEFAGMKGETIHESFDDQYTRVIASGAKARRQQRVLTESATAKRRKAGSETVSRVKAGERPVGKRHRRRILTGK